MSINFRVLGGCKINESSHCLVLQNINDSRFCFEFLIKLFLTPVNYFQGIYCTRMWHECGLEIFLIFSSTSPSSFPLNSPHLWNRLPSSFRQPHCVHSPPGSPHPIRISPHHSHHLRSHHLSPPRPFTQDLKLISFTNPFLHSHSYSFRTDFMDLNLYCIKGALVSFSGYVCQIKLNTQLSSPR